MLVVGCFPFDSVFHALNELGKRVLLAFHGLRISHQFVEPGLAGLRHDHADEPGGLAGARVRSAHIHQLRLAICDIN